MSYASDAFVDTQERKIKAIIEAVVTLMFAIIMYDAGENITWYHYACLALVWSLFVCDLEDLMGKKHEKSRRKKKINLPTDKYDNPVNIEDCLVFDKEVIKVTSLTFYGDEDWIAGTADDDFACDNIKGGIIVSLPQKGK